MVYLYVVPFVPNQRVDVRRIMALLFLLALLYYCNWTIIITICYGKTFAVVAPLVLVVAYCALVFLVLKRRRDKGKQTNKKRPGKVRRKEVWLA